MSTCSGCGSTHYCSRACQLKHWPQHKIPCKASPICTSNQELAALKKSLAEQEETLGVDHPETLHTVAEVGTHLFKQGKLKEAEVFMRRGIEWCEWALGPDHPGTLTSVSNLGKLLQEQGKLDLAEPFLRRALSPRHAHGGRQHGRAAAKYGQA